MVFVYTRGITAINYGRDNFLLKSTVTLGIIILYVCYQFSCQTDQKIQVELKLGADYISLIDLTRKDSSSSKSASLSSPKL